MATELAHKQHSSVGILQLPCNLYLIWSKYWQNSWELRGLSLLSWLPGPRVLIGEKCMGEISGAGVVKCFLEARTVTEQV